MLHWDPITNTGTYFSCKMYILLKELTQR